MDGFEVRMQFIDLLRKLNASQPSIQKVVNFALKFIRCAEDIWDCIIEEVEKGSLNSRMNILHFIDSLAEASLRLQSDHRLIKDRDIYAKGLYTQYLARDLHTVILHIVPEGKEGLVNLVNARQILETWREKRFVDISKIDSVINMLDSRPRPSYTTPSTEKGKEEPTSPTNLRHAMVRPEAELAEIHKRIEQDRERQKRLRERRWVQPVQQHTPNFQPQPLACFYPLDSTPPDELALDIEFANEWENTSDWNPDDVEAITEEDVLAFPLERRIDERNMAE